VKRCGDLLARARANPASLRFAEACTLAECHGWVLAVLAAIDDVVDGRRA